MNSDNDQFNWDELSPSERLAVAGKVTKQDKKRKTQQKAMAEMDALLQALPFLAKLKRTEKDPDDIALRISLSIGCWGFFVFFWLMSRRKHPALFLGGFVILAIVTATSYYLTRAKAVSEIESEERAIRAYAKLHVPNGNSVEEHSVTMLYRATYFGGHKKYSTMSDVTITLTEDRVLVKELTGHSEIRIDLPFAEIVDFGLATKKELTAPRMLLVEILEFAMKEDKNYFYFKYRDTMGCEHNPVFGELVGASAESISSQIYSAIEAYRNALND